MKLQRLTAAAISALLLVGCTNQQTKTLPQNEFPLSDVQLLDGPLKTARDLNIKVLLEYDVDRLLAPFRKEAGLEPKAESFPCWIGLDGHVGGHYLSAMAINYAATGNAECKKRMDYMIAELKECQEAGIRNNPEWGAGYLGGMPESAKVWSAFKKGDFGPYWGAWAPFYNIHKMFAGLRDAWNYCGNTDARDMFLKYCDWCVNLCADLTDEQMEQMLGNEYGGMNEVLADAYEMTNNVKYLDCAKRFSHKMILNPLAVGEDKLDNLHANTQIPKIIGFERIAQLSGDADYNKAARFFWETVVYNRSLAFGGHGRREHFPSKEACTDYTNDIDGPESCNSYNMLKLTEDLFTTEPQARYADYYERTMFNHILSTQNPEHGGYVYFTSARPRHYRVYSAPNMAMWCCVGTGMENHGKYNQFIYTRNDNKLYVNLFVASELDWKERGIKVRQETDFPFGEQSKITVTDCKSAFDLMLRYPEWVAKGEFKASLNGQPIEINAEPSSYISISNLKKGDVLEVTFPMHTSIERMPNVPQYVAIMHGPILLGMKTGTEDMAGLIADDGRWGQYASGELLPIDKAPIIIEDDIENIGSKLQPIEGKPLHFKLNARLENPIDGELEPFFGIHDSRYMIYWLALTSNGYKSYIDSLAGIEREKIKLKQRSTDFVSPGEQQPETDHAMQAEKSHTGNTQNVFFRTASNGGFFSYDMATQSRTDLALYVKYWGVNDWGNKVFDILIDDEKLTTVNNIKRWNTSQFKTEEYPIPASMLKGKKSVRVKFQTNPGTEIGGIYEVRLVKK